MVSSPLERAAENSFLIYDAALKLSLLAQMKSFPTNIIAF